MFRFPCYTIGQGDVWYLLYFSVIFLQHPVLAAQVSLLLIHKDIGPIATRSSATTNWISKVGCRGQTLRVKFCGVLESERSTFGNENSTKLLKYRCVDL